MPNSMADWYIDYTATNDGNGTTAAQAGSPGGTGAYNTLAGKTFASGDKVWIRRVTSSNQGSSLTLSTTGVLYIGWPKVSGDEYYSARPGSGTSNGWDSDSNNEAIIKTSTAAVVFTLSGDNCKFYRLKFQNDSNASASFLTISGNNNYFNRCFSFINATQSSAIIINAITGKSNKFTNCTFSVIGMTGSATVLINISSTGNRFYSTTFTVTNYNVSNATVGIIQLPTNFTKFQDTTITIIGTSTSTTSPILIITGNFNTLDNVTLTTTANTNAPYPLLSITGNNNTLKNYNVDYAGSGASTTTYYSITGDNNKCQLFGPIETKNNNALSLLSVTGNYNIIYLKNAIRNNTSNTVDVINSASASGNIVYCDNCQFASNPITSLVSNRNNVYSANHNGQSGLWKGFNHDGIIESSNTVRSGGEAFSIRFEVLANNNQSPEFLQFGIRDGQSIYVSLSSGSRTLTLYGAYKLFGSTPPTKQDLWFESEEKESDWYNAYFSTYSVDNAALESDSSTWTNDPSVVSFKITKTITVANSCVVPIRIYYYKFVANAYVYIDPLIVVT